MSMPSENVQSMGQRLKAQLDQRGLSVSAMASALGVSRNTIYNWFETAQFTGPQLALLSDYGVDIDLVLYGEAAAPVTKTSSHVVSKKLGMVRFEWQGEFVEIDPNDYAYVPVFDIEFGAGPGRVVDFDHPPVAWDAYRRSWLSQKGLGGAMLFKASICGDSMYPILRDGDVELFNASDKSIRSGEIYGIRIGDENIAKYLRHLPGNLVEVSSASRDPQHAPFTVRSEEFGNGVEIAGRLVR